VGPGVVSRGSHPRLASERAKGPAPKNRACARVRKVVPLTGSHHHSSSSALVSQGQEAAESTAARPGEPPSHREPDWPDARSHSHYSKGDRGKNFPAPIARVTSDSPLWDWATVARWLFENEKLSRDEAIEAEAVRQANEVIHSGEQHIGKQLKERVREYEACLAAITARLTGRAVSLRNQATDRGLTGRKARCLAFPCVRLGRPRQTQEADGAFSWRNPNRGGPRQTEPDGCAVAERQIPPGCASAC
jgi:hypothetical protein